MPSNIECLLASLRPGTVSTRLDRTPGVARMKWFGAGASTSGSRPDVTLGNHTAKGPRAARKAGESRGASSGNRPGNANFDALCTILVHLGTVAPNLTALPGAG